MEWLRTFLHMGGYAFYVWPAYGLSLIILVLNVIWSRRCEQQFFRMLRRRRRITGK
jgi:heme exporter protein CcmD